MGMDRRCARTATTIIIPMRARLTATTGLTGSQVECSSAPGHGMAGEADGVEAGAEVGVAVGTVTTSVDEAFAVDAALVVDEVSMVEEVLTAGAALDTAQAAASAAVMASMVAA